MKTNLTRQKLLNGQNVFGVFAMMPTPESLEVCALLGFDFVIIDGEHGPITEPIAAHMIRAADAAGITPIVRVPRNEAPTILRMLDLGAQGIFVPQVNSRADAERVVAASKYHPDGMRGMAAMRAADFGVTKPYRDLVADMNRETMVIVQCEHIASVNSLDDILQVKGIDAVFIGPGDLSQSMGKPAQYDDTAVVAAIDTIITQCVRAGVTVGIYPLVGAEAQRYKAMGVRMQGVSDLSFLADGARAWLRGVKADG